ncbi:MAG: hypothetical protein ACRDGS_00605, partial [Chloroflexota bacterium]
EVVLPFRVFGGLTGILGPEMQSTGEAMGVGETFAAAYWKACLGAGFRQLPFGCAVYLSGAEERFPELPRQLTASGCTVLDSSCVDPDQVDVSSLGMAIVLAHSAAGMRLIRRAVDAGVPYISTAGGVRGMIHALEEGMPDLEPVAISALEYAGS